MILSQTSEYALRALLHLVEVGGDDPTRVDDVAEALSVPRNYLSKILHSLARSGFLVSTRGPGGGFVLSDTALGTPLIDIIELFDPTSSKKRCFLGRPQCRDDDPCPAHERWGSIRDGILIFLRDTTLEDLGRTGLAPTSPK